MAEPALGGGAYARWEPERFETRRAPRAATASGVPLPTAAEIEAMHQAAQREGYAAGREDAQRENEHAARALRALAENLAAAWRENEERVAEQVVALAFAIAQGVVRGALAERPARVTAVVRDALAQLPVFGQPARLSLHPDDAALVRAQAGEPGAAVPIPAAVEIIEDATLARGDCRIVQATTEIDGTLAQRWRRLAAALGVEPPPEETP